MSDQDPVEMALAIVDRDAKDAGDFLGRQHAVDQTLAAEVRRLRAASVFDPDAVRELCGAVEQNIMVDELRAFVRRVRDSERKP